MTTPTDKPTEPPATEPTLAVRDCTAEFIGKGFIITGAEVPKSRYVRMVFPRNASPAEIAAEINRVRAEAARSPDSKQDKPA